VAGLVTVAVLVGCGGGNDEQPALSDEVQRDGLNLVIIDDPEPPRLINYSDPNTWKEMAEEAIRRDYFPEDDFGLSSLVVLHDVEHVVTSYDSRGAPRRCLFVFSTSPRFTASDAAQHLEEGDDPWNWTRNLYWVELSRTYFGLTSTTSGNGLPSGWPQ
jgi:hypothetical protein